MFNYQIKLLVLILIISTSSSAFGGGWQLFTTVNQIVIEGSATGDRIYVGPADIENPDNCTGGTNLIRLDATTKKGQYMLSAITTAWVAKKSVMFAYNGCDDWNRPVISSVWVK